MENYNEVYAFGANSLEKEHCIRLFKGWLHCKKLNRTIESFDCFINNGLLYNFNLFSQKIIMWSIKRLNGEAADRNILQSSIMLIRLKRIISCIS